MYSHIPDNTGHIVHPVLIESGCLKDVIKEMVDTPGNRGSRNAGMTRLLTSCKAGVSADYMQYYADS